MYVEFQELKFRNFLSFGKGITTINFYPGLNLITGKNGQGKSGGLLDPLSFCLFGKPYRKIKNRELINRINKKGLYVECKFKIGNDIYNIIRQQLPDTIEILKNNNKLELLSTKRQTQDEINNILGINYTMFKQVISLAINYNKPYLSMTTLEKRDIIESIFNVKVFGEMLRQLKVNMAGIKTKVQMNERELKILEENLVGNQNRLNEMKHAEETFEETKQNDIKRLNDKIDKYETERESIWSQIETFKTYSIDDFKKLKLKKKEFQKEYQSWRDSVNEENYKIQSNNKKIKFLKENEICPTCKRSFSKDSRYEEIDELNIKNEKHSKEKDKYQKKADKAKEQLNYIEQNIEDQNNLKREIISLEDKAKWFTNEIIDQEERRVIVKKRSFDFDIKNLQIEQDKKMKYYTNLYKETEEEKTNLYHSETASVILSDNGIKAYFFKKLMPILNVKINEYLKKFEMPIKMELNELLEDKIYGIEKVGQELSYMSHSEGEKKRIDISILLAFIDVTKIICSWDCSLLIMDELLDGQVDEDGLEVMLSSLSGLISNNKNMSIYIISHRLQDVQEFDSHFRVTKASGFSKIEKIY